MKYKLVKHHKLSGNKASIYSVVQGNETESFLEKFVNENQISFIDEIKNILMRLKAIGHTTGARENFFKIFEGRLGDGVCALYDEPGSKLRLYCIRYGTQLVVVGNGGPKSKRISAFQENEKLTEENYFLRWLSVEITNRIKEKEITFTNDHLDFSGNLEFQDDERS
jgi:hypothetical protein